MKKYKVVVRLFETSGSIKKRNEIPFSHKGQQFVRIYIFKIIFCNSINASYTFMIAQI
jgi:hypothetical protein